MSDAGEIINAAAKNKAPGILKGIQPQDPAQILAKAGPHAVRAMMGHSFPLWCQYSGIEVDGRVFSFDKHRYLLPIYADTSHEIVWMKAAQLGATIYMLLRLLWMSRYLQDEAIGRKSVKSALYFPTGEGVETLSKDRLAPLIRSNPELYDNLSDDVDTQGLKKIKNVVGDESSLYMLYVGGRASKDSVPLDVIAFDEVRLIDPIDIDQCLERISHSDFKYKIFMSTAGLPSMDISARYDQGKQFVWTVKCGCTTGDPFVPSESFPDCIVEHKGEVYIRCPKCKFRIRDPQVGQYIARNPTSDISSYSVSQLISAYITPKEIWDFFKRTTNIQEFYNAKLGLPYVDEENRPVSEDVFNACINPELKWAHEFTTSKRNRAMGVDHGSGNCYVVISETGKDGRRNIVHLELIEAQNPRYFKTDSNTGISGPVSPFIRLHEMMREFNVEKCVIDAMPNINEAQQFARNFPTKVFIAWYKDAGQDMVLWTDRVKPKEAIRKGSKEIKLKWQVLIKRYDGMDFALRTWTDQTVFIPPLGKMEQVARNEKTGKWELESMGERLRDHLKRLVRHRESLDKDGENTGRYKLKWMYMGGDPHFAHAMLYSFIALERMRRKAVFVV